MLLLARGLRARGHEQWIACPQSSDLELRAREEGFSVLRLPSRYHGPVGGALALHYLSKAERPDILHAHDGRGQSIAWLASPGARARRVASRRVTFLPHWRALHRLKYQYTCDAVIAVSNYVRGLLLQCGVPGRMIEVIYDGIEIPDRLPGPEERIAARQRWGLGDSDFVVGNLGAFRQEKGLETALQAANLLASSRAGIRWLFAAGGSPAEIESGVSAAAQAGSNIRVIPAPEELSGFFASIDLYVMPSLAEGLGSSALLAMAYSLPVAASRAGGLPEIVEHGKTGWLFSPGSAQALAEIVAHAVDNREELKSFGVTARVQARQFSDDIMTSRTEALYLQLQAGLSSIERTATECR